MAKKKTKTKKAPWGYRIDGVPCKKPGRKRGKKTKRKRVKK